MPPCQVCERSDDGKVTIQCERCAAVEMDADLEDTEMDDRKQAAKRFLSPNSSNAEPPTPRARTEEAANGGGGVGTNNSVPPQNFIDLAAPIQPPSPPPQRKGVEIFLRPSKHYQDKWKI